jgi:hypothetical protein
MYLFPRLATASGLVALGSVDRQFPLRILDGGVWQPAGPALPVDPTAVRAALDPDGTPFLALEYLDAGWSVRVLRSDGREWRQLGGDLPAEPWDGGTIYPPRHLVDMVVDGLSRPVVAFISENASLSVVRWEDSSWTTLGTPARGRGTRRRARGMPGPRTLCRARSSPTCRIPRCPVEMLRAGSSCLAHSASPGGSRPGPGRC